MGCRPGRNCSLSGRGAGPITCSVLGKCMAPFTSLWTFSGLLSSASCWEQAWSWRKTAERRQAAGQCLLASPGASGMCQEWGKPCTRSQITFPSPLGSQAKFKLPRALKGEEKGAWSVARSGLDGNKQSPATPQTGSPVVSPEHLSWVGKKTGYSSWAPLPWKMMRDSRQNEERKREWRTEQQQCQRPALAVGCPGS